MKFRLLALGFAAILSLSSVANVTPGSVTSPEITYRILHGEDHRITDVEYWRPLVQSPARILALRAIGHIGADSLAEFVLPALADRDHNVRVAAAEAANFVTGVTLEQLRARLGQENSPVVRGVLSLAIARRGDPADGPALVAGLDTTGAAQPKFVEALAIWLSKANAETPIEAAWLSRLVQISRAPNRYSSAYAAYGLGRFRAQPNLLPAQEIFDAIPSVQDLQTKAHLLRTLGRFATTDHSAAAKALALSQLETATAAAIQVESARALGAFSLSAEDLARVSAIVQSSTLNLQGRISLLEAIARRGVEAQALGDVILERLNALSPTRHPYLAATTLKTLGAINLNLALPKTEQFLQSREDAVVVAAVQTRALRPARDSFAELVATINDSRSRVRSAALESLSTVAMTDLELDPLITNLREAVRRNDLATTATACEVIKHFELRDLAGDLQTSYATFTRADDIEAKLAILQALGQIGTSTQLPFLYEALRDDHRQVGLAAADAIQAISGTDVRDSVRTASEIRSQTPSVAEINWALSRHLILRTDRGDIVLEMLAEAPLAATNFVRLAANGYYNGLTMHRIVPNFVAQGGDPRGDGYGGPGYLIRDEFSTSAHWRGTVGMASAGKDTAGSQFFVNHGANLHLNGNYTVFAKVVRGMDVVDRLQADDHILQVIVD